MAAVAAPVPQPLSWIVAPVEMGGRCERVAEASFCMPSATSSSYSSGVGARACLGTKALLLEGLFIVSCLWRELLFVAAEDQRRKQENAVRYHIRAAERFEFTRPAYFFTSQDVVSAKIRGRENQFEEFLLRFAMIVSSADAKSESDCPVSLRRDPAGQ